MPSPADVERAKLLHAMHTPTKKIAKEMGVTTRSIYNWLKIEDSPEFADQLEQVRSENREKFVNDSWTNIHALNEIMAAKIKQGEKAFKNPKDVAVCIGVAFDKVIALERPEAKGGSGSGVVINILPPAQHGDTTRIIADPVPVPDESSEVLSDGGGGGGGEDVLALPPGRKDGTGESGVPRDDSSIDLPQPGRLCDPDANTGTLGEDEDS